MTTTGIKVTLADSQGNTFIEHPDTRACRPGSSNEPLIMVEGGENIVVVVHLEPDFELHGAEWLQVILAFGIQNLRCRGYYFDANAALKEGGVQIERAKFRDSETLRIRYKKLQMPEPVGVDNPRRAEYPFPRTWKANGGCLNVTVTRGLWVQTSECMHHSHNRKDNLGQDIITIFKSTIHKCFQPLQGDHGAPIHFGFRNTDRAEYEKIANKGQPARTRVTAHWRKRPVRNKVNAAKSDDESSQHKRRRVLERHEQTDDVSDDAKESTNSASTEPHSGPADQGTDSNAKSADFRSLQSAAKDAKDQSHDTELQQPATTVQSTSAQAQTDAGALSQAEASKPGTATPAQQGPATDSTVGQTETQDGEQEHSGTATSAEPKSAQTNTKATSQGNSTNTAGEVQEAPGTIIDLMMDDDNGAMPAVQQRKAKLRAMVAAVEIRGTTPTRIKREADAGTSQLRGLKRGAGSLVVEEDDEVDLQLQLQELEVEGKKLMIKRQLHAAKKRKRVVVKLE